MVYAEERWIAVRELKSEGETLIAEAKGDTRKARLKWNGQKEARKGGRKKKGSNF